MKIEVIGMPIYYGCDVKGADLGFDVIENKLEEIFQKNQLIKKQKIDLLTQTNPEKYQGDCKLKYVTPVMEFNKKLYEKTLDSFQNGNLPIMIGGDHSGAIGTVSAALDYYQGDVSVIWIDSHLDIHTDEDTPSGNIHGIPLSVCIGRCSKKELRIGKNKLKPSNLYYIGPRDDGKGFEQEEIDYVRKENISCYMDEEVHKRGIKQIVEEITKKVKTKYVHLSFDFDSIKTEDFPSVNVLYQGTFVGKGGISFEIAKETIEELLTKLRVCSIDLVEYNPLLDKKQEDRKKVEEILKVIDHTIEG